MPAPACPHAVGIDFGTSNSALTLASPGADGSVVTPLPIDPASAIALTSPTLLWFADELTPPGWDSPSFGTAAVQGYLGSDLSGRLMQALKRHLPSRTFEGTWIGGRWRTVEELAAGYLHFLKQTADAAVGEPVARVVLGRPARFHKDDAADTLAQERLEAAARIAGFTDIRFQIEPIAAARSFESELDAPVLCLVGDMGGGTSDFTVIRLSPARVGAADRSEDVLGVAGVPVAGNDLDARLVYGKVAPTLGLDSRYRPVQKWVPLPPALHHAATRWHQLCVAGTPANLDFLDRALRTSDDPAGLGRLRTLIVDNLGYELFRAIEASKVALSAAEPGEQVPLRMTAPGFELDEVVTPEEFAALTVREVRAIAGCCDGLLDGLGLGADDIGVVFLTGGTSKVPAVRAHFESRFAGRIVATQAFTSVGHGLGIEAGERMVG